MYILSIILVVLGVGWGLLEAVINFNKLLQSGRFGMVAIWTVISVAVLAFLGASLYVFGEFVVNKGPDDCGSMWHAGYPLAEKYGKRQAEASYELQGFDKDADGSGSGTYHIHFKYDDHAGMILCHYDKATWKFDRDEIDPDK